MLSKTLKTAGDGTKKDIRRGLEDMTNDDIVKKNISLTFDFMRKIINEPNILDIIPDDSEIDFVEADLPRYSQEGPKNEKTKPVMFRVEHTFNPLP
ncbi:MAG: hypothetical protein C0399_12055 [Syntrophus sp. (in: bacteria)]|nr:hypothetical protein [Syntrophus sp. (in: bacteria)]